MPNAPDHARGLGLAGAPNARDLGGLGTGDGRILRSGKVLRSEALARLTDADVVMLAGIGGTGVRFVVDFRGEAEIKATGADRLPTGPDPTAAVDPADPAGPAAPADPAGTAGVAAPERVELAVFAPDHDIYTTLGVVLAATEASAVEQVLGDGRAERIMLDMYRWFVSDAGAREPFARTLRLLADPDRLPLLFHCTAGKDRTGWMAAVLLTALGVERDAVVADYLLSNRHPVAEPDGLTLPDVEVDPDLLRPILQVRPAYLDAAFQQVEDDYGDFATFVRDGLGVDDATLVAIGDNLLTAPALR